LHHFACHCRYAAKSTETAEEETWEHWKHVPWLEKGLALMGDENSLDFASHGPSTTLKSYPFSTERKSRVIRTLAYWFSNPKASMLSDKVRRRMLLLDLSGQQKDNC
jgi:hypothetical protein